MHKKALSLFEVIVATILLAITMTGLASVMIAGARHIARSRARMTSGELGKLFLDPLQNYVKESDWDPAGKDYRSSNPLHKHAKEIGTSVVLDRTYTPYYAVTTAPDFSSESPMRSVTVNVTWTEK